MLKGFVLKLLLKFLGDYVEGITSEALQVSVWEGEVKLQNLRLKREALDKLGVPFILRKGTIGELRVVVPWTALGSEPVQLSIRDVFLLVDKVVMTKEEVQRRQSSAKQRALKSAAWYRERARAEEGSAGSAEMEEDSSTLGRYLKLAWDNLRVQVSNVHIRYEDTTSHKGQPFAAGLTLDFFSLATTNERGEHTFVDRAAHDLVHRTARIRHAAVYWDPLRKGFGDLHGEGWARAFRDGISQTRSSERWARHEYLLEPSSAVVSVAINEALVDGHPKLAATIDLDRPKVRLTHDQFVGITFLHRWVLLLSNPKRRWHYAYQCVTGKPVPRRGIDWHSIVGLGRKRRQYVDLYARTLGGDWVVAPTEEVTEQLEALEESLTYEQVLLFRAAAEAQWQRLRERALRRTSDALPSPSGAAAPEEQGWGAWAWSFVAGPSADDITESSARPLPLTAEELSDVFAALDLDTVKAAAEAPPDLVLFDLQLSLKDFSMQLVHETGSPLMTFGLAGSYRMQTRTSGWALDIGLTDLRISDNFTAGTAYPSVLQFRTTKGQHGEGRGRPGARKSVQVPRSGAAGAGGPSGVDDGADEPDSFRVGFASVESKPLDGAADFRVRARLKPLQVVVDSGFAGQLVSFFDSPGNYGLRALAAKRLRDIQESTRAGMMSTLNEHRKMDVDVSLRAPEILVPLDPSDAASSCLHIDLGHVALTSLPATFNAVSTSPSDRDEIDDSDPPGGVFVADRTGPHPSLAPASASGGVQYDFWRLAVSDVGASVRIHYGHQARLQTKPLVNPFTVSLDLRTSILPKALSPDRLKLRSELPCLTLSLTPQVLAFLGLLQRRVASSFRRPSEAAIELDEATEPAPLSANSSHSSSAIEGAVERELMSATSAPPPLSKLEFEFIMARLEVKLEEMNEVRPLDADSATSGGVGVTCAMHDLAVRTATEGTSSSTICELAGVEVLDTVQPNGTAWQLFATSYVAPDGRPQSRSDAPEHGGRMIHVSITSDVKDGQRTAEVDLKLNELHVGYNPETVLALKRMFRELYAHDTAVAPAPKPLYSSPERSTPISRAMARSVRHGVSESVVFPRVLSDMRHHSAAQPAAASVLGSPAADWLLFGNSAAAGAAIGPLTGDVAGAEPPPLVDVLRVRIVASLSRLSLTMNKEHSRRNVARFELSDAAATFEERGSLTSLSCSVGGVRGVDLCSDATHYSEVFGRYDAADPLAGVLGSVAEHMTGGSGRHGGPPLLELSVTNWRLGAVDHPDHDTLIQAKLLPARIVYVQQLWLEVLDYFSSGLLGTLLGDDAGDEVSEMSLAAEPISRVALSVDVLGPQIILPRSVVSDEWVSGRIASITWSNELRDQRFDLRELEVDGLVGDAYNTVVDVATLAISGLELQMFSGTTLCEPVEGITATWTRSPDPVYAKFVDPANSFDLQMPAIGLRLAQAHYAFLRGMLDENIGAAPPDVFGDAESRKARAVQYDYETTEAGTSRLAVSIRSVSLQVCLDAVDEDFGHPIASFEIERLLWSRHSDRNETVTMQTSIQALGAIDARPSSADRPHRQLVAPTHRLHAGPLLDGSESVATHSQVTRTQFTYTQSTLPNGENHGTLELVDASLVLIPDALDAIATFFTNSDASVSPNEDRTSAVVDAYAAAPWSFQLVLSQPQIAVLEDATQEDCSAFALRGNFSMLMSGEGIAAEEAIGFSSSVHGAFTDFAVYMCHADQLTEPVGVPCVAPSYLGWTFSLQRKPSEVRTSRHVSMKLSEMNATVGRKHINLITSLVEQFSAVFSSDESEMSVETAVESRDVTNYLDDAEFKFAGLIVTVVRSTGTDSERPLGRMQLHDVASRVGGHSLAYDGAASFSLAAQWWNDGDYVDLVHRWDFNCELEHGDSGHKLEISARTPLRVSIVDLFVARAVKFASRMQVMRNAAFEAPVAHAAPAVARSGAAASSGPFSELVVGVVVPRVSVELLKYDAAGSTPIIDIVLVNVTTCLHVRPHDKRTTVDLSALVAQDLTQPEDSPFRTLVSSCSDNLAAETDERSLVTIRAVQADEGSELFTSSRDSVDIMVNTLDIQWNPETVASVYRLFYASITGGSKSDPDIPAAPTALPREGSAVVAERESAAVGDSVVIGAAEAIADHVMTIDIRSVRLSFNKERIQRRVATVEVRGFCSSFSSFLWGDAVRLTAHMNDLLIRDERSDATIYGVVWGQKASADRISLDSDGQSMIELSLQSFSQSSPSYPGVDSRLRMSIQPMKLVYVQQFWMELIDYTMNGVLGSLVMSTAGNIQQLSVEQSYNKNMIDIVVRDPELVVPRSAESTEAVSIGTDRIIVNNSFASQDVEGREFVFNTFAVALQSVNIGWDGEISPLASPIPQLQVLYTISVEDGYPPRPELPAIRIDCEISDPIELRCSQQFYNLLLLISEDNFAEVRYDQTEVMASCDYHVPSIDVVRATVDETRGRCGSCAREFDILLRRRACDVCGGTFCIPCTIDRVYDREHARAVRTCAACLESILAPDEAAAVPASGIKYDFDADNVPAQTIKTVIFITSVAIELVSDRDPIARIQATELRYSINRDASRKMVTEIEVGSIVISDARPSIKEQRFTQLVAPVDDVATTRSRLRDSAALAALSDSAAGRLRKGPVLNLCYTAHADGYSELQCLLSDIVVNVISDLLGDISNFISNGDRVPRDSSCNAERVAAGAAIAGPPLEEDDASRSSLFKLHFRAIDTQLVLIENLFDAHSNAILVATSLEASYEASEDRNKQERDWMAAAKFRGLESFVVFGDADGDESTGSRAAATLVSSMSDTLEAAADDRAPAELGASGGTGGVGGGGGGGSITASAAAAGRLTSTSRTMSTGSFVSAGSSGSTSTAGALQLLPRINFKMDAAWHQSRAPMLTKRSFVFEAENAVDIRVSYNDLMVAANVVAGWSGDASDVTSEADPREPVVPAPHTDASEFEYCVDYDASYPFDIVFDKAGNILVIKSVTLRTGPSLPPSGSLRIPDAGDILVAANGALVANLSEQMVSQLMRKSSTASVRLQFRSMVDTLTLTAPSFSITAVNDIGGRCTPLVRLTAESMAVSVHGIVSQAEFHGALSSSVALSFFNLTNVAWEPLIEPWRFVCLVVAVRASRDKTVSALPSATSTAPASESSPAGAEIDDSSVSSSGPDIARSLFLTSNSVLRINGSHAMATMVSTAHKALKNVMASKGVGDAHTLAAPLFGAGDTESTFAVSRSGFAQYIFSNESGLPVRLRLCIAGAPPGDFVEVESGVRVPLRLADAFGADAAARLFAADGSRPTCEVQLQNVTEPLTSLSVDRVGCYPTVATYGRGERARKVNVLWEVALEDGAKLLTIRSNTSIHNYTGTPLEALIRHDASMTSFGIVEAASNLAVPVAFSSGTEVLIRPIRSDSDLYSFCDPAVELSKSRPVSIACKLVPDSRHGAPKSKEDAASSISPACNFHAIVLHGSHTRVEIYAPVKVVNLLPVELTYEVRLCSARDEVTEKAQLAPGKSVLFHEAPMRDAPRIRCQIGGYSWSEWVGLAPRGDPVQEQLMLLAGVSKNNVQVMLRNECAVDSAMHRVITLYAPFWTIDRTELRLVYGESRNGVISEMAMQNSPTVVEVYENARYAFGSWRGPSPTERPQWSNAAGRPLRKEEVPLPSGWMWDGPWRIDASGGADADGWDYAFSFNSYRQGRQRRGNKSSDCVRRRRWVRTRVPGGDTRSIGSGVAGAAATLCLTTPREGALYVRKGASAWSEPLFLQETAGHAGHAGGGVLELAGEDADDAQCFELAVEICAAPPPFALTSAVVFRHRYLVYNHTASPIQLRQVGTTRRTTVPVGGRTPFQWTSASRARRVQLCPEVGGEWSGTFGIGVCDDFPLAIVSDGRPTVARIACVPHEKYAFVMQVVISAESRSSPMYVVRNLTDCIVEYKQAGTPGDWCSLSPRAAARLGWRSVEPDAARQVSVRLRMEMEGPGGRAALTPFGAPVDIGLEMAGTEGRTVRPGGAGNSHRFDARVVVFGPTKELIIGTRSLYRDRKQMVRLRNESLASMGAAGPALPLNDRSVPATLVQLEMEQGIQVSFIDRQPEEIVVIGLKGIAARFVAEGDAYKTELQIQALQIDDMVPDAPFPVVLAAHGKPDVPQLRVSADVHLYPSFHHVKGLTVAFAPTALRLSRDILISFAELLSMSVLEPQGNGDSPLVDACAVIEQLLAEDADGDGGAERTLVTAKGAAGGAGGAGHAVEALPDDLHPPELIRERSVAVLPAARRPVVVDVLSVHRSQLHVSFSPSRTGRKSEQDQVVAAMLPGIAQFVLGRIELDDARVNISSFTMLQQRVTVGQLVTMFQDHYTRELKSQVLSLVGSIDALGKPASFIRHMGSGIEDLFLLPIAGSMETGVVGAAKGLVRGGGSLVRHGVYGVSDTLGALAGALNRGLARATLDDSALETAARAARQRPRNVFEGILLGGKEAAEGIAGGVSGLVTQPIEGAVEDGLSGALTGIGKGVLGLFARPAMGLAGAASRVMQGVRNTAASGDSEATLEHIRPRRTFYGRFKVLKPYSINDAVMSRIYRELGARDHYVGCVVLSGSRVAVVGTSHVTVVSGGEILREFPLTSATKVTRSHDGAVTLVNAAPVPSSMRVMPADRRDARVFVEMLASAIAD